MTFRTLERFLASVGAFVVLQYVLITEGSGAHATGEHLVSSVLVRFGADRVERTKRRRPLNRLLHALRLRLRCFSLHRSLRDSVAAAAHNVVVIVVGVVVRDAVVGGAPGGRLGAQRGRHRPRRVMQRRRRRGRGRRCPATEQSLVMVTVERRAGG